MVKLFVEGGGDDDSLKTECRKAFSRLLERAGFEGRMPRIVACGGRQNAFNRFCSAVDGSSSGELALLLVDSEEPVDCESPWEHVAQQNGQPWRCPEGVTDDHLHLMVQCMETWIVADRQALQSYYGHGFNETALGSAKASLESAGRHDLRARLEKATRSAKTKGTYSKGQHSFKLLGELDPERVRKACPWAERFFSTLDRLLNEGRP